MKARIPKTIKASYPKDFRAKVLVHGAFHYQCEHCRKIFSMWLEDGVEGPNKKQPCPFIITCPDCGGRARHISWSSDIELDILQPLWQGAYFFAFDNSKNGYACGKPSLYLGNKGEKL